MMKIILLVDLFPPKWLAGTEIASYNIAKYLAKTGHEVHVITSLDKGFPKKETIDRFCIHRTPIKKIRFIGIIFYWFHIFLEIKRINPNIVHVQSISTALPGIFSMIFLKKPYVIWGQGSDVYIPDKFTKFISKIVLKNASIVIALSEDMKRKMNTIYKREDIVILPNGIELDKFKGLSSRKQNNDKTKKTIIFVGTLRPVKGIEYLIKAMNSIHEQLPNTDLLIVGDGPDREKMETLVQELNLQDCIHFVGKVSNEEIPEYMAQADLFALPSLSEGFGIVNIEAMAAGLPIVTTNVGGLPEIVINGENGFLVEPKNPEALAETILLILSDNDLKARISMNNQMKAEQYSWDIVVKNLISIYESLSTS
ncbi:Glycosyltransferase [Methanosarcina lacustris Z-7289]|uniref:Glycosyltransferase n=2 Tax=Methanosarcina lacustris TaxID=170861 RepID=A0A0E3SAA7_9EURY|nr:Glycosyltransferase [Methanosarcina lacustris Z-7289]